ncbi:MAG: hypothetical protein HOV68_00370, partial [Streptomycetaceae bacterium]|nr:hypothetical protein [Streptomycetaceae bacterium]
MDRTPARHAAVTDFATWRSLVHDAFFAAELHRPADHASPFSARLRHKRCGALGLARVEAAPHNFRRTAADVARQQTDAYDVVLVLDGHGTARQDDRGGTLTRGDLVISDTTRPYQIDFTSPFHLAQLVLPRALLGTEPERVARVTGVPVATGRGTASLLATLLTQATEHDDEAADMRGSRTYAAEDHIADAVAALCRGLTAELL